MVVWLTVENLQSLNRRPSNNKFFVYLNTVIMTQEEKDDIKREVLNAIKKRLALK